MHLITIAPLESEELPEAVLGAIDGAPIDGVLLLVEVVVVAV
jgi:hypothetical protein